MQVGGPASVGLHYGGIMIAINNLHSAHGAGLDFTVIDKDGVRTEMVLEWPDLAGKKIDPRRAA